MGVEEEIVLDPLNSSIFEEEQESYEEVFSAFEDNLTFKNYTIDEWFKILDVKDLRPGFTDEELENFTIKVINQTDMVYSNLALAESSYLGLKRSLEKSMMMAKQTILEEIDAHNKKALSPADKKKYPNNDTLEALAYNRCEKLQTNFALSEVWNAFWQNQAKKIYSLNQRMTSLSVSKNIEMKQQL